MSDGTKHFGAVRLPRDTAKMLDQLVEAAASWGALALTVPESPAERTAYKELAYVRKWLAEHLELLCEGAGVEPGKDDQLLRFL